MSIQEFATLALSFPGTEENPHFDRRAFKVVGKRIFATLHEASQTANLKLTPVDQSVFCLYDKSSIYPTPNKWGVQGWTTFEVKKIPKEFMLDALSTAYNGAALKNKKK
ncbi:MmcQ/YjbR family DNA-binding protein [Chryseolinea sp. H1M3-3]|uniref:MmcQ/YjbR family DNA-binding protein n=1 Tax=Chryseolinea sp. H1M3-3 TaxID=3034144 RepID=UPI0023EC8C14|nr:MmcQ/YjbR family DNA-binding protein [Chryseolinea sp. H1M3-3]